MMIRADIETFFDDPTVEFECIVNNVFKNKFVFLDENYKIVGREVAKERLCYYLYGAFETGIFWTNIYLKVDDYLMELSFDFEDLIIIPIPPFKKKVFMGTSKEEPDLAFYINIFLKLVDGLAFCHFESNNFRK